MVMGPEAEKPLSTTVKLILVIGGIALFWFVVSKGWHPFLKLK